MTDLEKLREERSAKTVAAQAILDLAKEEERECTPPEKADLDKLLEEIGGLKRSIEGLEQEERMKLVQVAQDDLRKPAPRIVPPQPISYDPPGSPRANTVRAVACGPLKSFKGKDAELRAHKSGMWLKAQLCGDEDARRWCYENLEHRILQTNVNTAAGYLIPPEFEAAIITNRETWGVARRFARVIPMSTDVMNIPRYESSPDATWVTEGTTITAADPVFNQIKLVAKKLARLTRVTAEMLGDSAIDLADWLATDMALAFAEAEDDALFNGDGTSSFGGIRGIAQQFDDDNTLAGAQDAASGNDQFEEIDSSDLSLMMGNLPQYALQGAAFYCSQVAFSVALERLAFAAGGNTVSTFSDGLRQQYFGYPVRISQKMPAVTTALDNQAMFLFGDMARAVVLGDRRQITVMILNELFQATDEIGIKATERVDINAFGVGDGTDAGPIVALIGQA